MKSELLNYLNVINCLGSSNNVSEDSNHGELSCLLILIFFKCVFRFFLKSKFSAMNGFCTCFFYHGSVLACVFPFVLLSLVPYASLQ